MRETIVDPIAGATLGETDDGATVSFEIDGEQVEFSVPRDALNRLRTTCRTRRVKEPAR